MKIDKYGTKGIMKITNKYGDIVYKNYIGELHRTDGPAIEYDNGMKRWYINDTLIFDIYHDGSHRRFRDIPLEMKQSIAMELLKV